MLSIDEKTHIWITLKLFLYLAVFVLVAFIVLTYAWLHLNEYLGYAGMPAINIHKFINNTQ